MDLQTSTHERASHSPKSLGCALWLQETAAGVMNIEAAGGSPVGATTPFEGKEEKVRKLSLIVGAGIGFVLGSRAGNGPYRRLEARFKGASKRSFGSSSTHGTNTSKRSDVVIGDDTPRDARPE